MRMTLWCGSEHFMIKGRMPKLLQWKRVDLLTFKSFICGMGFHEEFIWPSSCTVSGDQFKNKCEKIYVILQSHSSSPSLFSQFLHSFYLRTIQNCRRLLYGVWRLVTNFFFLGTFSINFGIRLLMIARYGVQLENGPFQRRTADFLWMMLFGALSLLVLSAVPYFWSPFLGISLVFMLLYVWSREFPNAVISIYGLVNLKAFYLPWAMLGLDAIFGSPIMPNLLGIVAGHLYYFLTVLHPLAGGRNILKTPAFIHKLVARWRIAAPATNAPQPDRTSGVAFRGRSHRLSE